MIRLLIPLLLLGLLLTPALLAQGRKRPPEPPKPTEAQVKVYLTASPRERARRRRADLVAAGIPCDVDQIEAELLARDESDRNRAVAPLKAAPDAIELDTTGLTLDQVVDRIVARVQEV